LTNAHAGRFILSKRILQLGGGESKDVPLIFEMSDSRRTKNNTP